MFRNATNLASLFGIVVLVTSAVALAAAGGNGNKHSDSSSIDLVLLEASAVTAEATASPGYAELVTFDVSTNATTQPFVHLRCWQNGGLVLESWKAWFYGAAGVQTFALGPTPAWLGGAADCTAYLENWDTYHRNRRTPVLASTSFHVDA
jgi:hypothetical protein